MSGWGEMARDAELNYFIRRWVPDDEAKKLGTDGSSRWWLARARAAEAELEELKAALRVVKKATGR